MAPRGGRKTVATRGLTQGPPRRGIFDDLGGGTARENAARGNVIRRVGGRGAAENWIKTPGSGLDGGLMKAALAGRRGILLNLKRAKGGKWRVRGAPGVETKMVSSMAGTRYIVSAFDEEARWASWAGLMRSWDVGASYWCRGCGAGATKNLRILSRAKGGICEDLEYVRGRSKSDEFNGMSELLRFLGLEASGEGGTSGSLRDVEIRSRNLEVNLRASEWGWNSKARGWWWLEEEKEAVCLVTHLFNLPQLRFRRCTPPNYNLGMAWLEKAIKWTETRSVQKQIPTSLKRGARYEPQAGDEQEAKNSEPPWCGLETPRNELGCRGNRGIPSSNHLRLVPEKGQRGIESTRIEQNTAIPKREMKTNHLETSKAENVRRPGGSLIVPKSPRVHTLSGRCGPKIQAAAVQVQGESAQNNESKSAVSGNILRETFFAPENRARSEAFEK
ncbi:hypothetical protein DFH09DRAFT_1089195 [Mycena vulgaris]|nr:hypothetical protein DFH09DRAFT_1089195 [Mycena vulgaris]